MTIPPRRWSYSLRTVFVVVTAVCLLVGWLTMQMKWARERREALEWLEAQKNSWYAPPLPRAKFQADAPLGVRLFGGEGIVSIGMDVDQFSRPVPYSPERLRHLFPEGRVDWSYSPPEHDGIFEKSP
jgi:hypothetical protein